MIFAWQPGLLYLASLLSFCNSFDGDTFFFEKKKVTTTTTKKLLDLKSGNSCYASKYPGWVTGIDIWNPQKLRNFGVIWF